MCHADRRRGSRPGQSYLFWPDRFAARLSARQLLLLHVANDLQQPYDRAALHDL
jgi:hypothetical protein